jgi:hypothetical protein
VLRPQRQLGTELVDLLAKGAARGKRCLRAAARRIPDAVFVKGSDPAAVVWELARVARTGGEVILVDYFRQEEGFRGWLERRMVPFQSRLGLQPVSFRSVTRRQNLREVQRERLPPLGLTGLLRFVKAPKS